MRSFLVASTIFGLCLCCAAPLRAALVERAGVLLPALPIAAAPSTVAALTISADAPIIAVNMGHDLAHGSRYGSKASLLTAYIDAVVKSGGLPLLVPPSPEDVLQRYLDLADGVLFTGGPDLPPSLYGDSPHSKSRPGPMIKAESDLRFMKLAMNSGKPLLGICLGMQTANVALGGALIQHVPNAALHESLNHEVTVLPDTLLSEIIGEGTHEVNSNHHQAVDPARLGLGLRISAWAADGTAEALELIHNAARRFFIFVQWHPERIADAAHTRSLLSAFIDAARRHRLTR